MTQSNGIHIACTICSRDKSKEDGEIAAQKRYLGEHIAHVRDIALGLGCPFWIVSGEYGLISADTPIPYYDKLLTQSEIGTFSQLLERQMRDAAIRSVLFYSKTGKTSWVPYGSALADACMALKITFAARPLSDI
jgi:hypothetical protein